MAALSNARRIVVKIGSALLVDRRTGALRRNWLETLAADVARLKGGGAQLVLVSSGSIALGRGVLGLGEDALALEQSQAAAAVGQIKLAQAYESVMSPHGSPTAQVLLTLEDSRNRRRYLNARATLEQLLSLGVLPIVNENDTVATDEIRFGDNDRLGAQIAATIGADVLVLLSDVDGLYTANPQTDDNARHIPEIHEITQDISDMAGDSHSSFAKGGMKTKLLAAKTATAAGCAMAICAGNVPHPLRALEDGAKATWFRATLDPQTARKRWISGMKPQGSITMDAGAARALRSGKSLLPAGVVSVSGAFERGDPVTLIDVEGHAIGVGLTRYTAIEAQAIKGYRSSEVEGILGHPMRSALVHRDDMAL